MRFVIFAWRSETERARFCVNYDIKSQRSVTVGKTFGKLIGRFEDREMVLGGYSLGAQVVLTALSQDNGAYVLATNPDEMEQLAVNTFESDTSRCNANVIIVDNRLYMRTDKAIYCISSN